MELVYDHNKGQFYSFKKHDNNSDLCDTVKVHKWPYIKTYEDRSNILTVEFSGIRFTNQISNQKHDVMQIEMLDAEGYIWKKFTTDNFKIHEHTNNSTIVIFEVDYWEEKNSIN